MNKGNVTPKISLATGCTTSAINCTATDTHCPETEPSHQAWLKVECFRAGLYCKGWIRWDKQSGYCRQKERGYPAYKEGCRHFDAGSALQWDLSLHRSAAPTRCQPCECDMAVSSCVGDS